MRRRKNWYIEYTYGNAPVAWIHDRDGTLMCEVSQWWDESERAWRKRARTVLAACSMVFDNLPKKETTR